MGFFVCGGAVISCPFGAAPGTFQVLPANAALASMPLANIMDNKPFVNIPPFGMCNSMANPTVAAATAAAMGALTPMPCVPAVSAPWAPGCTTVLLGGQPALNDSSQAVCNWGGVLQFSMAGQTNIMIP